jgi:RNA polymerase sigma factor (sigma-70 family)
MTPALARKKKPDAAFESLYRRHVHEVYRYTVAVLGNPADAEDVTQTTFLNAYRAIQAGERPRKPAHWLRAIAHNVCKQRFRQAARRPQEVVALDEFTGPAMPEEPEGPSAGDIKRALQSLPFNQRSALVMRELEGRRQTEIAAALGLSESAVEALLFRARRAMREQLESSITCGEAERAISRQLDKSLPRAERGRLRAHLRECAECATFARQARAQRGALKALGAIPLPASLLSWGGGSTGAGVGTAAGGGAFAAAGLKLAAGVAAVVVAVGAGDAGIRYLAAKPPHRAVAAERHTPGTAPSSNPAALGTSLRTSGSQPAVGQPPHARSATHRPAHPRIRPARPGKAHAPAAPAGQRQQHGRTAHSHVTPVRAHGAPARSHPAPAKSHGRRVRAHGPGATGRTRSSPAQGRSPSSHRPPPRAEHPARPGGHRGSAGAQPPDRPPKPPKS